MLIIQIKILRIWNLSVEKKTLSTALGYEPRSFLPQKDFKFLKFKFKFEFNLHLFAI